MDYLPLIFVVGVFLLYILFRSFSGYLFHTFLILLCLVTGWLFIEDRLANPSILFSSETLFAIIALIFVISVSLYSLLKNIGKGDNKT